MTIRGKRVPPSICEHRACKELILKRSQIITSCTILPYGWARTAQMEIYLARERDFGAFPGWENFYGLFYGRAKFCCKTAQLDATRRESDFPKCLASARVRKLVKTCAKSLA